MALHSLRFWIREGPLGTLIVTVLDQRGPSLALCGARFWIRNVEVGPPRNTHLKKLPKNNCPLRAERRRREARREKCNRANCTLPTIHLGPASRRPALGLVFLNVSNSTLLMMKRLLNFHSLIIVSLWTQHHITLLNIYYIFNQMQ